MAGNGGKREGAGRKAGVPNKDRQSAADALIASGQKLPHERLLDLADKDGVLDSVKASALAAAAPYFAPKFSPLPAPQLNLDPFELGSITTAAAAMEAVGVVAQRIAAGTLDLAVANALISALRVIVEIHSSTELERKIDLLEANIKAIQG